MKTILKVSLGVALAAVVLIVGCGALVSTGFNAVQKGFDEHSITHAQFESVKTGTAGNTRKRILTRFGEPQVMEEINDQPPPSNCIYYNRRGEFMSTYEFCFDARDRVKSKSRF